MSEEKSVVVELKKHYVVFGSDTSILVFCMVALMSLYFIPMSIKFSVRSISETKICESITLDVAKDPKTLMEKTPTEAATEIFSHCLAKFEKTK